MSVFRFLETEDGDLINIDTIEAVYERDGKAFAAARYTNVERKNEHGAGVVALRLPFATLVELLTGRPPT